MKKELCIKCKERPIFIKKWQLCKFCYHWQHRNGLIPNRGQIIKQAIKDFDSITSPSIISKYERLGELHFVKSYFTHRNWIPQPAQFNLDGQKYTPDFYDAERNTFIEVSRTRQAYSANKHKYDLLRKLFPKLKFEIHKPDGSLLEESQSINAQLIEFQ